MHVLKGRSLNTGTCSLDRFNCTDNIWVEFNTYHWIYRSFPASCCQRYHHRFSHTQTWNVPWSPLADPTHGSSEIHFKHMLMSWVHFLNVLVKRWGPHLCIDQLCTIVLSVNHCVTWLIQTSHIREWIWTCADYITRVFGGGGGGCYFHPDL